MLTQGLKPLELHEDRYILTKGLTLLQLHQDIPISCFRTSNLYNCVFVQTYQSKKGIKVEIEVDFYARRYGVIETRSQLALDSACCIYGLFD
ncbi:hypothetical protein [Microcoleus sp. S13_B4]|uniref:hypothetical protein n=1 Tax=Microcoleus sp. S13_B4 TaxID=3055408 RepID=UPI002FD59843